MPATNDGPKTLRALSTSLGLELDEQTIAKIGDYQRLLIQWSAVYNLTAVREPLQMQLRHLADCLAVLPSLRRFAAGRPISVLDVGSGGGLPGALLAIAQPDWQVECVDAVAKKVGFVRQVAAQLGLVNLRTTHARVEKIAAPMNGGKQVVICRAFSSLADFTRLSQKTLAPAGVWVAMKGKVPDAEIAELPPSIAVFHVEHLTVPGLDAERCLVWMRASS